MKEKIFNSLKQEYKALGLSDEILQGHANALAANGFVTDENLSIVISAQKDFLAGLQSGIDKRVTSVREKALAEAKKTAEDEAKAKEEAAKKADADKGKSEWEKEWEKRFEELSKKDSARETEFQKLKEANEKLERERTETTRTSTILSKAKELGIPEWRIKEGFAIFF